jgi:hypothetical protein
MAADRRYRNFSEFWPLYVREHSRRLTRRLHFSGTLVALLLLLAGLAYDWRLLWLVPAAGYGAAWYAHFFVECNRPATFRYPLWSLAGDFKMFWLTWRGQMDAEAGKYLPDDSSATR